MKKVLDLDHTRGIVMGATCDIDHMVTECIKEIHSEFDETEKTAMLGEVHRRIREKMDEQLVAAEKVYAISDFEGLFDEKLYAVYSAYDRLKSLGDGLKKNSFSKRYGPARTAAAKSSVNEYMMHVVPQRNILGHQILKYDGKVDAVVDSKGNPVTIDTTRVLRRDLLRLRGEIRGLYDALRKPS